MKTKGPLAPCWDQREIFIPLFVAVVAFVLRYNFRTTYPYPMMIHEQDAVGYLEVAKSFLHFHIPPVTGRPPGYPLVIALFALLPVELERAARLASMFMDASIVFPLYYLARVYLTPLAAFATCLLWGFFSYGLYFSTSPLSQSSYLCFLLFAVALLHQGMRRRDRKWLVAAGAVMALSFLARPEGVAGFGCCLALSATVVMGKGNLTRQNLWLPASFFLGFLLFAGPFLVAMRLEIGGWTVSALSAVQMRGVDASLRLNSTGDLQSTAATGIAAWSEFFRGVPAFLNLILENGSAFFKVYLGTFPTWANMATFCGGLLIVRRSSWRDSCFLLVFLAVVTPALVANLPKNHSYIYPLFAMGFVCFGSLLDFLKSMGLRTAARVLPKVKPIAQNAILSFLLLLPVAYLSLVSYQNADAAYQDPKLVGQAIVTKKLLGGASEVIRNNSVPQDLIMSRWGLAGYYASRAVVPLPQGQIMEVLDYGRKNRVALILIDTGSVLSRRKELLDLLAPLEGREVNPAYGIEVVASTVLPDIGGYVIYRYRR